VRDAFGDALDRMARREELERLRAEAADNRRTSVAAEVAQAVRRVVEHHPDTTVAVSVESAGASTAFIRQDPTLLGPDPD
jgi:hypothetical protein